ncbi:MAG TPA: class I SAM-dependent methyltransferase [Anaeromyxobacteraceae bacterium]|nr:class I SAM-dependent methyltransferase [Anaeromyxobacteraceae bacterium]
MRPRSLLVAGPGPLEALDCVDPLLTRRAVGIDRDIQGVAVARQRYRHLGPALELYRADPLRARLQPQADFDLVYASLLFEELEAEPLARAIASWLAPGGICAVVSPLPPGSAEASATAPADLVPDLLARTGLRRAGSFEARLLGPARHRVAFFRAGGRK